MSTSTDFGADPFGVDPLANVRIFRRRSTVIFASVFAALAVVLGVLIGSRDLTNGFVGVASIAGGLAFAALSLVMGVWPHVALHQDRLAVHNTIFCFDVPYISISELKPTRLGLVIRTHSGKLVPVAAYASGSGKRVLGHADAADELIRAVQERTAFVDDSAWREAPRPVRRWEVRNSIVLAGAVAIAVALIVLAATN